MYVEHLQAAFPQAETLGSGLLPSAICHLPSTVTEEGTEKPGERTFNGRMVLPHPNMHCFVKPFVAESCHGFSTTFPLPEHLGNVCCQISSAVWLDQQVESWTMGCGQKWGCYSVSGTALQAYLSLASCTLNFTFLKWVSSCSPNSWSHFLLLCFTPTESLGIGSHIYFQNTSSIWPLVIPRPWSRHHHFCLDLCSSLPCPWPPTL